MKGAVPGLSRTTQSGREPRYGQGLHQSFASMIPISRRPVVGVMGASGDPHAERSRRVGTWIARAGYHLLTGGGPGVMAAVTEAFVGVPDRRGLAIGVLPASRGRGDIDGTEGRPPPGYPNPWVEIAIATHLDSLGKRGGDERSRNHVNILSSDVVIFLPGSAGTASEAKLALRYGRPSIAYLDARADLPGLPDAISVEPEFARVEAFVRDACERRRRPRGP